MPDAAVDLMDEYASSVVSHMTRRLARVGLTDATRYEAEKLAQAGYLMTDVLAEMDKVLSARGGESALEKEVRDAFVEAATRSTAFDNRIYQAAGKAPQMLEDSWQMQRLLRIGIESTSGELVNLTRTTASTSQAAFIRACDVAYMQVSGGTTNATQAIAEAIRGMARDGLYVLYPTGHRDTVEVATRRAVLTGVNQTVGKIQIENMRAMEADYVETTAHMGARDSHIPWQGRVFRVSTGEFERETGYGTGPGLCGWNCRHSFFPFFPGVSERVYDRETLRAYENATVTYDGKEMSLYDATQKQRQYERDIRRTKRELAGYSAAMENADETLTQHLQHLYTTDSLKLKRQRVALADLQTQTGLLSQSERQQVYGFGHSEASKSSWAVRKAMGTSTLPKVAKAADTVLQGTLASELIVGVVPKGAVIEKVRVIAGAGSSTPMRNVGKRVAEYGGDPSQWAKKSGTIATKYKAYEVHWDEWNEQQYNTKLKGVRGK